MDIKIIVSLARLMGSETKIEYLVNCLDKKCPNCETNLVHTDFFIHNNKIYGIGSCPKCKYRDPKTHYIQDIYRNI